MIRAGLGLPVAAGAAEKTEAAVLYLTYSH